MNIMLIEDNEGIRETLASFLELEGFQVQTCSNGELALMNLLRSERLPDVILLDLWMPVMDGTEFRRRQLEEAKLSYIPVVIMSGDLLSEELQIVVRPSGIILKPFDLDEVPRLLQQLSQSSQS
jgi:CheY-like chemotaxis protein